MEKSLKQRIQEALQIPDSDFDIHETDLYVVDQSGAVMQWLRKNYEFYKQVGIFIGQEGSSLSRKRCLDVPFAAWQEKYNPKSEGSTLMDTNSL